jgi:hypothetical protein
VVQIEGNLHRVADDLVENSSSTAAEVAWFHGENSLQSGRSEIGANEQQGRA